MNLNLVFFFFLCLFLCSCELPKDLNLTKVSEILIGSGRDRDDEYYDEDEDYERDEDFASGCSRSRSCYSTSDYVSLEDPYFIDQGNVGEYVLKGRCDERDLPVHVRVNGCPIDVTPKCHRRKWEVVLNLTPLASVADRLEFEISHNGDTICEEVRVAFQGPINYVSVAGIEGVDSFYAMKYEAKVKDKNSVTAISEAQGKPAYNISHSEAKTLCSNLGTRYSLMSNEQWQSLAWQIADVDENWSLPGGVSNRAPENQLSCGVVRGTPQEAKEDDLDDCSVKKCAPSWDRLRRTHYLPSGEVIWDVCGNVGEMMRDKMPESLQDESFTGFVHSLTGALKRMFGPEGFYTLGNSEGGSLFSRSQSQDLVHWNFGYANIRKKRDLIVRGSPGEDAGIFSVDVNQDQSGRGGFSSRNRLGFRCVYLP